MSIKSALTSRLTGNAGIVAIAGARVFPVALPQTATRPALTYRRMPNSPHDDRLTQPAGRSKAIFEVRSWADSYEDADLLAEAVRQAMQGFSGTVDATKINVVMLADDYDDYAQPQDGSDRGIFCTALLFHITYQESIPT